MRLVWSLCLPVLGCLSADTSLHATETEADTSVRLATYNVKGVGSDESEEFTTLAAILYRIDADVVCLQEVGVAESNNLADLAAEAGYDYVVEAEPSPAIGGEIRNACLGQVPISLVASYTADELSPGFANDVGRDILVVRAEPAPGRFVGLLTVHLKAGGDLADRFRRQVETERLAQAIDTYRQQWESEAVVVLGDFNEQIDDGDLGQVLSSVPGGLPDSYTLGPDIELPLVYHPFARMEEVGFSRVDATWEDSTLTHTWNEATRLDYVYFEQALLQRSEVYNACEDDGVDGEAQGDYMEKRGEPLRCYTSGVASDHLPVVVDLVLP